MTSLRDEAQTIISHLAEIGPRRAGSPQEATAAAFVNAQMRRAGMGVTTSPLLVTPRRRRLYGAVAVGGLIAALTTIILPLPALILALAAVLVLLIDAAFGPLIALGPGRSSQSIIGTQAIAGEHSDGPREPRWRVVLLAPLDSPVIAGGLAALAWPARSAALLRVSTLLIVMAAALIELLRPRQGWALLAIPATILLGLQLAAALREPQPAAQDGSMGALSAMLLATRQLRELRQVELWAVAVGASSLDSGGVEDLLRSYPFEPARTLMIAVEQLAGGPLACHASAGRAEHELAGRVAAALDIELSPAPRRSGPQLALPLRRKGLRAITLYGRARPASPGPPPEVAQQSNAAVRLIEGIVHQLEETA